MQSANLSSEDTTLLLKFRQKVEENGGELAHDLSDPEHRAFVKLMHNVCGNTEADFPGLHGMIDAAPPPSPQPQVFASEDDNGGWETAFGVPEVGFAPSTQLASATGYGTVVNGFQTCNLSLLVLAPNGGFLANGSAAGQTPLNSLAVQTYDGAAQTFVPGSTAMMTYSYKTAQGQYSSTVSGAYAGAVSDPQVDEPQRENGNTNSYNPNAICIGLGRPTDLTRCDYIYNEPTQDNPIGRLPLVGNVSFTDPIKTLQAGTNFLVDVYVIRTDNGGKSTRLDATDLNAIYAAFTITPGNNKNLQWSLPMQPNRVPAPPPQPYNPVTFSNIPWATEMVSYLTVNITVTLDDGSANGKPVTVTIQSSDVQDADPIDGVTYIKPIEFVWHCLGSDTRVSMADGSTKTIPQIVAGDTVLAGAQDHQTVSVTHNGAHHQDVYLLETACGKTLIASAEHVIFTASGPKFARDLAAGDALITSTGPSALKAIKAEPGDGRNLWNLSLGEAPQITDKDPPVGQFYANDILVGDARATRAIRHRQINDIDWVKANVPAAFHADVDSTFRRRDRVVMR